MAIIVLKINKHTDNIKLSLDAILLKMKLRGWSVNETTLILLGKLGRGILFCERENYFHWRCMWSFRVKSREDQTGVVSLFFQVAVMADEVDPGCGPVIGGNHREVSLNQAEFMLRHAFRIKCALLARIVNVWYFGEQNWAKAGSDKQTGLNFLSFY